ASSLALEFHAIDGQSEKSGTGFVNHSEANAIIQALSAIEDKSQVAVVAATWAQKKLILSKLENMPVMVLALQELKHHQFKKVLFSATLMAKDIKPSPFDEGLSLLYTVLSTSLNQCVLYAHQSLFNASTHSPTGFMAKWFTK